MAKNNLELINTFITKGLNSKTVVLCVYSIWVIIASLLVILTLDKVKMSILVILILISIFCLHGAIQGIRDKKAISLLVYSGGKEAVKAGYYYLFGCILSLFLIYFFSKYPI